MSRCPYCHQILPDAWIKSQGASLMGKASGKSKARGKAMAQATAFQRWKKRRNKRKGVQVDLIFPDDPIT